MVGGLDGVPGRAAAQPTTAGVAEAINAYRQSQGLPPILVADELTRVAQAHVADLATYRPENACNRNLHSWSNHGAWTSGCYDPNDQATWPLMWNKPKEIANYPSNGYEIAAWATPSITAEQAVELWRGDAPHDDVMLNHGIWANLTWQALGGWAADGYACAWFGEVPGTAPAAVLPTLPPTQAATQPSTQAPTQSPTQPATESATESATQPTTESPTNPATEAPSQPQSQVCPYGPNQCLPGYVWRVAKPGDLVCVTPEVRAQAADDNAHAAERVDPSGAYGPNSCQQGYVWRDAWNGDAVCVTPDVRDQAHDDNAHAEERKDPACAEATPVSGATPVDTEPGATPINMEPGGDASGLNALDPIAQNALLNGKVPGVSVAIAKEGKLVFAKAYGVADPSTGEAMTADHRLRIASVTKPITATAIMGLIEQGQLSLSDTVFGEGALLGTDYGTQQYSSRLQAITLQHLLEHTAGGWTNAPPDPMFQQPDLDVDTLISWVLDNRPLDNDPGTNWAYSNFGYCLLGRVIEHVTGQSYADYVRDAVLAPCGITDMEIAGNTLDERRDNEVVYDASNTPPQLGKPYEIPVARMDSHGGWIGTATDLLRFAVRVDRFPTVPDILTDSTIAVMVMPSAAKPAADEKHPGYAKGWNVNIYDNWWHDGKLSGTQSFLVRSHDGFCWAAIANGNGIDLESMGWSMIQNAGTWPPGEPL